MVPSSFFITWAEKEGGEKITSSCNPLYAYGEREKSGESSNGREGNIQVDLLGKKRKKKHREGEERRLLGYFPWPDRGGKKGGGLSRG